MEIIISKYFFHFISDSNELFFTGRNIFNGESPVSSNFTETTVNGEPCEIIRKPFRLEEFDDCLSNNEEAESFVNVLAGNEHFVVLTCKFTCCYCCDYCFVVVGF